MEKRTEKKIVRTYHVPYVPHPMRIIYDLGAVDRVEITEGTGEQFFEFYSVDKKVFSSLFKPAVFLYKNAIRGDDEEGEAFCYDPRVAITILKWYVYSQRFGKEERAKALRVVPSFEEAVKWFTDNGIPLRPIFDDFSPKSRTSEETSELMFRAFKSFGFPHIIKARP